MSARSLKLNFNVSSSLSTRSSEMTWAGGSIEENEDAEDDRCEQAASALTFVFFFATLCSSSSLLGIIPFIIRVQNPVSHLQKTSQSPPPGTRVKKRYDPRHSSIQLMSTLNQGRVRTRIQPSPSQKLVANPTKKKRW